MVYRSLPSIAIGFMETRDGDGSGSDSFIGDNVLGEAVSPGGTRDGGGVGEFFIRRPSFWCRRYVVSRGDDVMVAISFER